MGKGTEAVSLHAQGNNCAQCVLKVCRDYTGLDDAVAGAVASGFGGGVRSGEICGAASGAVMAIGLACAKTGKESEVAELAKQTVSEFTNKYGTVRCIELKQRKASCDELIEFGAETADAIISKLF